MNKKSNIGWGSDGAVTRGMPHFRAEERLEKAPALSSMGPTV